MFKKYNLLAKKEGTNDLDIFIREHETFDEIPLLSRERHVKIIKDLFSEDIIQEALINLSVFYVNNIYLHAKSNLDQSQFNNFFSCLTFDPSDMDFWGFYVPNILVTRKIRLFKFITKIENNKRAYNEDVLFSSFVNLSLENSFIFCRKKDDDDPSVSRQYVVQHAHFERLRLA